MASITIFAWSAVWLGVFLGMMLGKATGGHPGLAGGAGLAIAGVLLGVGLFFATGIAHSLCSGVKLCDVTSSTTTWDVAYPVMFIPAYWIAMGIGAAFAPRLSDSTTPPMAADGAATASALAQFRSRTSKPKPGCDVGALRVTCECGASNGTYATNQVPA